MNMYMCTCSYVLRTNEVLHCTWHCAIVTCMIAQPPPCRGRYASIRLCNELTTDRVFVAKVVPLEVGGALHEYEVMRTLSHPRIVSLEDAYQSKYSTILILEQ